MNNLGSLFLEIAASEPRGKIIVWTFCEKCMTRNDFILIAETELTEIYACPDCGTRKEYTVR